MSFLLGQPNDAAAGCGIASTTGLRATDGASLGTQSAPAARSRCSQMEESGIHTFGTRTSPAALPTPVRVPWCCPAIAAAMSAGSAAVTATATHFPLMRGLVAVHCSVIARTAGSISGAAATGSRI